MGVVNECRANPSLPRRGQPRQGVDAFSLAGGGGSRDGVPPEEEYTPPQAARILRLSRRRVTQMLNAGELGGAQDPQTGRWSIPQRAVHARLKYRSAWGAYVRAYERPQKPPLRPPSSGIG